MTSRDSDPSAGPADPEPVLQRWSRLKAQARAAEQSQAQPSTNLPTATPTAPSEAAPPAEPPRVELPDLDLLGHDSDYSAFLAPGVDLSLRRRALRKLFASPKFNVFDGLDTYRDDFTSFPALGDIVTADMRHQVERLARKALEKLEMDAGEEALPATRAADTTADTTTTAIATQASTSNTNLATTTTQTPATSVTPPSAQLPTGVALTAPEQPLTPKENDLTPKEND